ncbi:MAG: tail protein X [Burkholderiaceae bacterium]
MQVRAQQNDTVDQLVWRHLGSTAGYVEQTLERNPALAAYGPILPHGTVVDLPEPHAVAPRKLPAVQLWD